MLMQITAELERTELLGMLAKFKCATIQDELHWLPVQQGLVDKLCNFIYKCFHQNAQLYLSSMCIRIGKIDGCFRHTRLT